MITLGMGLNDPVQRHDITKLFDELNMKGVFLSLHWDTNPMDTNILNES